MVEDNGLSVPCRFDTLFLYCGQSAKHMREWDWRGSEKGLGTYDYYESSPFRILSASAV